VEQGGSKGDRAPLLHLQRIHPVLLASLLALTASCAEETADAAAPSRLAIPEPVAPEPCRVQLEMHGALELKAHGTFGTIDEFGPSFVADSADVEGPGARTSWTLRCDLSEDDDGEATFPLTLTLEAGDRIFEKIVASPRDGVRMGGRRTSLDIWLPELGGESAGGGQTASVHVKGKVIFPASDKPDAPDEEVSELLAELAGVNVRPYSTFEFGEVEDSRCVSVMVSPARAARLVDELRERLGKGWVVFVGTRGAEDQRNAPAEVVIGPGGTQFDIVRLARTTASNGMGTEAIAKQLARFDQLYRIDIRSADSSSVDIRLKRKLKNPQVFAQQVALFCPSVADPEGPGIEQLAAEFAAGKTVSLFWE